MTTPVRFIDTGTSVQLVNHTPSAYLEVLPTGIYEIRLSSGMNKYFYLEKCYKEFILPSKLYGEVEQDADLVLKRYLAKPDSLGALLTGTKGSGKSLIASLIINKFINKLNKPVIIVNDSWYEHIDELVIFMSKFKECLFVFDEFDKHYDKEDQNCLLNFFDDKSKSHRLSLVIANEQDSITEYFLDRPSRFFYHFKYENIDKELLIDYLVDNGLEDMISKFEYLRRNSYNFTFDILQSIVDEIKLRNSKDFVKILKRFNFDTDALTTESLVSVSNIEVIEDSCQNFPQISSLDFSKAVLYGKRLEIPGKSDNGSYTLKLYLNGEYLRSYDYQINEYVYLLPYYQIEDEEGEISNGYLNGENVKIKVVLKYLKTQMSFLF